MKTQTPEICLLSTNNQGDQIHTVAALSFISSATHTLLGTGVTEYELTEPSLSFFAQDNCEYLLLPLLSPANKDLGSKCSLENGKAVGMLELPFEVWIGTSKCELEILDKKVCLYHLLFR